MILIDTSVWIDFLRQRQTRATQALEEIVAREYPFGLSGIIVSGDIAGRRFAGKF
jgi:predicted nucleic acid-binding protein